MPEDPRDIREYCDWLLLTHEPKYYREVNDHYENYSYTVPVNNEASEKEYEIGNQDACAVNSVPREPLPEGLSIPLHR